jgi:hypothetical protein
MSRRGNAWRIWAKALGAKEGDTNQEADRVALVRTGLVISSLVLSLISFITNIVIMLGIWRHWND